MLDSFKKFSNILDKLLTAIIIVLFILMFGITNLNVITRYFFNRPIVFSVEMGRYCFVSIIFLGAIFTTKQDRHIHVDFFTGLFPKKIQFIIEQFGRLLMGIFFAILTFYTCRMAAVNVNVVSSAMQIPMAVPYGIMAFGSFGVSLESFINVYEYATGKRVKTEQKEEDLAS